MSETLERWLPIAGSALLTLVAAAALVVFLRRRRAARARDETIARIAYDVLKNVLLPNGMGGHIHVNYLLLTQSGLAVLDLIDVAGAVFGGEQMREWTVIGRNGRRTFPNPLDALYDRIAAVRLLAEQVPVVGHVVFTSRAEFPKGRPPQVLRLDDLASSYDAVDRSRREASAAFADIWHTVRKNAEPNPLAR